MMKINNPKEVLKLLISNGISFKLHKETPVIYSKNKVDPELFKIAKKYREGIARLLIKEKESIYKKYEISKNTEKKILKIILEEKFNMKL